MAEIILDVWLYGGLGRYGGNPEERVYANLKPCLPEGTTVCDLLAYLHMPTEERGITFINGDLSAMVGMQPDLDHILKDGDRVAFFHLNAMWPFQYRNGAAMIPEMREAVEESRDMGLHHNYEVKE
jgi:hypothetical protein